MKRNLLYLLFVVVFVLGACKNLKQESIHTKNSMPVQYSANDTLKTSIANINWKQYYTDTILQRLIDTAIANNYDLQVAIQRIEIARSNVKFNNAALLPKIDANTSIGTTKYARYTQEYAGNVTTFYDDGKIVPNPLENYYLGLNSVWEIDIWKKLRNQKRASVANYLASVEGKNFVISNLVSNVAILYYELLALDNEYNIVKQTIQKREEALEVIKLQKQTGRTNELAVQQFQAQLLDLQAFSKEIAQRILETENKLNFVLARFPKAINRNDAALFLDMPATLQSGLPSELLSRRPDIRQAEQELKASNFDVKAARAAFFPNINIAAAIGFQSFNAAYLFNGPSSIGNSAVGGLVAPLVNRNALKNQFKTAKSRQITAMYNYQKTILNAYVEVVNELSNIKNLQEINTLKKQQSDVLSNSVEISSDLYKTAKANYLEVLLAQENSLRAKIDLVEVQKRQKIATVNMYKSLGGGW